MVDNVALGQVSSKYFCFPSQYHSTIALYTLYTLLLQGQTDEAWEPSKNNALSEIVGHWADTYLRVFPVVKGW
jgi:hypothetical protein